MSRQPINRAAAAASDLLKADPIVRAAIIAITSEDKDTLAYQVTKFFRDSPPKVASAVLEFVVAEMKARLKELAEAEDAATPVAVGAADGEGCPDDGYDANGDDD